MNMDFQLNYGLDRIKLSTILRFCLLSSRSINHMSDSLRKCCDNNAKRSQARTTYQCINCVPLLVSR